MTKIDTILSALKDLDLKNTDPKLIITMIKDLGQTAVMGVDVSVDNFIYRGRYHQKFVNYCNEDQITYIKDTSIIPPYNRASVEGEPFFYGCPLHKDEHMCQVQTCYEVMPVDEWVGEEPSDEYVTMGKWQVTESFKVAALAHHTDFLSRNELMKQFHGSFLEYSNEFPEKKEDFLKAAEFFSDEFAKEVSDGERYNYKISAAYTRAVTDYGFDGVMYPSAKGKGEGQNIAILPSVVDRCMKLEKAAVWRIRRMRKNIMIVPFLYADKFKADGKFEWIVPTEWVPEWLVNTKLNLV